MAEDKDIRSVKEAFDQERHSAPEGLWETIYNGLDREDSEVYGQVKDAFVAEHKAPEQLWDGIDRALTIERSWYGLRSQLVWNVIVNRIAQVLTFTFLLFLSLRMAETDHTFPIIDRPERTLEAGTEQATIHTEAPTSDQQRGQPGTALSSEPSNSTRSPLGSFEVPLGSIDPSLGISPFEQPSLKPIELLAFAYPAYSTPNLGRIAALIDSDEPHSFSRSRFAVGALLVMNNPNLQNNTADEAARTASNTESEFSINYSFGLTGHISTPRGDLLEARYVRNKVMNQAFQRFEDGAFLEQNLVMLYDHLDLHYQRAIWFNGQRPALHIGAGAFGAYMNAATLIKENALVDRTDRYGRWDAGLSLGAKKQWSSGPLFIELDLRSEWGLTNIHRGDQIQPARFDLTYTHNTSLSMALKYAF